MPSDEKVLKYLNDLKKEGLRPSLICAMIIKEKVGMFASNKYPGWEFVQGGMELNELPIDTFEREVLEELGYHFYRECHLPPKKMIWLFEDQMKTRIKGNVITAEGVEIKPTAKYYIIFAAEMNLEKFPEIDATDSGYSGSTVKLHKAKWVGYDEGLDLVRSIQSPQKREIIRKVLHKLKEKGLIK